MSELQPVSPRVPGTPPPGWYVDGSGFQRWWDGAQWGVYAPAATAAPGPAVKEVGIAYLLALLLGAFGAHHFYLGNVGRGITFILLWWIGWLTLFLVIGGLLLAAAAIWFIVDLCTLPGQVRTANANRLLYSGRVY